MVTQRTQTIPDQNYMGVNIIGVIKVVWIYGVRWGHKGIDSTWCGCQGEESEEGLSSESLLERWLGVVSCPETPRVTTPFTCTFVHIEAAYILFNIPSSHVYLVVGELKGKKSTIPSNQFYLLSQEVLGGKKNLFQLPSLYPLFSFPSQWAPTVRDFPTLVKSGQNFW